MLEQILIAKVFNFGGICSKTRPLKMDGGLQDAAREDKTARSMIEYIFLPPADLLHMTKFSCAGGETAPQASPGN
jgi:hypothetical protein